MNAIIQRVCTDAYGTQGVLIYQRARFVTLEPQVPIPAGIYNCVRFFSPKFKRELFKLTDVPGHTNVELHLGNTYQDTQLCILVGMFFGDVYGVPGIQDSLVAIIKLMKLLDGLDNFALVIKDPPA